MIAAFASSFTRHSPSTFSATRISPRSSAAIVSSVVNSEHLLEDRGGLAAFLLSRNKREADVPPAARAEERPGPHQQTVLAQPTRELLGRLVHRGPQIHRRRARDDTHALRLEHGQEQLALAPIDVPRALDM